MSLKYVVGVDGSENSRRALEWAAGEAARDGATVDAVLTWRAPLTDLPYNPNPEDLRRLESDWSSTLDQVVAEIDAQGILLEGTHAGRTLVDHANEANADLLVVGTRGRGGFLGLLLGSVAEYCLHHGSCPTAFVPLRELPQETRAIVGVDGSDASMAALKWALARAERIGGEVTALQVWNFLDKPKGSQYDTHFTDDDAMAFIEEAITSSGADRAHLDVAVANELPSRALLDAGESAGLLVLGSHGRNVAHMMLAGSTAHQVSQHTPVPLIVHR
jgi:nucleotide-binding universal stress UspA family protein